MRFWINYAAECYAMSEAEPTPLIFGFSSGFESFPWEEISEKEFNEWIQTSIEIEEDEKKRRQTCKYASEWRKEGII